MFTNAIVRTPCRSIVHGLSSAKLGKPDYQKALQQHEDYIRALEKCGLEVTVLPPDENFPDSTFIEDVALLTPRCAVITNPGAQSRKGETRLVMKTIRALFPVVEMIEAPGTVEAGDIMMAGDHYFIGLSERTNSEGAGQMISILESHGFTGSMVELNEVLHLKTGLGYLEDNNLLACGEFLSKPEFKKFNIIRVCHAEAYAANSVWINGRVLVPAGFPKTRALIESAGYEAVPVDVSEFRKLDGGLSCLSLRF